MTARDACAPLCGLNEMDLDRPATVAEVVAPGHAPEWGDWLAEIGFLPGEKVRVLTRAMPGGDPIVVRVGDSTFALRCAEAACVRVQPGAGAEAGSAGGAASGSAA